MGCSHGSHFVYNKLEGSSYEGVSQLGGPYIHPNLDSFEELEKNIESRKLISLVTKSLEDNKNRECLGYRKQINLEETERSYTFFTYGQVQNMVENFARYLRSKNLTEKENFTDGQYEFVGIFAKNCVEWVVSDFACQLQSITSVTLYSTLGEEAFKQICNETRFKTIFVSPENVSALVKYKLKHGLKYLKIVVVFDLTLSLKDEQIEELNKAGLEVHLLKDISKEDELKNENNKVNNFQISNSDTVLTICYTSGTTGNPKGAQITQNNFFAQMENIGHCGGRYDTESVHLSYLPLAHVLERMAIFTFLTRGGRVGFISGEIRKTLLEDMGILKPTIMVAVPRVLSNFRQLIFEQFEKLEAGCKKSLVEKGLRVKKENFESEGKITHGFYDAFVFNKITEKFGGRIQHIVTGSAPLTKELATDIKILFSVPIVEAFGMTETTGAATCSYILDTSNESVGGCVKTGKIKLIDVPEMNYYAKDLNGELCIKGPLVFKGYFNNPEETKKIIDSEGWLHTGDIAKIEPIHQGVKIVDRAKEIFKLAQGEYVAPSKLESVYLKSKYVLQICVCGNSTKNYVVAVIVPNKLNVKQFLINKGKIGQDENPEDFYNDKELHEEIKKDFDKLAKENELNSLEKIQAFYLSPTEFTIDNGLLAHTFKLVRRKVAETFKVEIEKLYS